MAIVRSEATIEVFYNRNCLHQGILKAENKTIAKAASANYPKLILNGIEAKPMFNFTE